MLHLKQSTTITLNMGPFVDKTDGVTEETALTLDVEVSKNGAAFGNRNSATAITHDVTGWYRVELDTTDTNTLGRLLVKAHDAANALPVWVECMVMPANVWDSLYGADKLDVNVEEWNATAVPAEHTAGYPIVTIKDGTGTGEINTNAGAVALVDLVTTTTTATNVTTVNGLAANVITAASMNADASAEIADAVWDEAQAGHVAAGSFGEIATEIADILTDTGTTLQAELDGIQADTEDIQSRIPAALASGNMKCDVLAIDGSTTAADRLQRSAEAIVFCTVGAASTTTSIVTSAMDPAAAVTDQFKGRIVIFNQNTTTANLRGQATDITASTAGGVLTVTALTTAPASGDTFTIT